MSLLVAGDAGGNVELAVFGAKRTEASNSLLAETIEDLDSMLLAIHDIDEAIIHRDAGGPQDLRIAEGADEFVPLIELHYLIATRVGNEFVSVGVDGNRYRYLELPGSPIPEGVKDLVP